MTVLLTNNAKSTLAADVADIDTTLSVQAGDATKFPAPGADEWFPITVVKADTTFEIMRCTGRTGAVLTVTRAQEGTTAKAFATGDRIDLRLTAAAIAQIQTDAAAAACPAGMIADFAMSTAPAGWLKANGAAISRTSYAALFAAIGTIYGVGDGSTTFNVPDGRGEFRRGWDDGRGVDAARAIGSAQAGAIESHTHTAAAASGGAHTHAVTVDSGGAHTHTGTTVSGGAHTHTGTTVSGGSHNHTGTTDSGGTHTHTVNYQGAGFAGSTPGWGGGTDVGSTGSGGAHTHTFTTSTAIAHTHTFTTDSGGAHTHTFTTDSGGAHTHTASTASDGAHTHTITVDATGAAETRPRNLAALVCIKY